ESSIEKRYQRKDGRVVWVQVTASAIHDENMRPAHIAAIVQDISGRRAAEESLRESEAKLRAFYESAPMPMGVVEISEDGKDIIHLYDNPATAQFFELGKESTANRAATSMGVPPEILAMWVDRYRESERRGQPVQFEYEYRRAEGTRWMRATVACIGPGASGRTQFCYVAEDITDRKRIEEAQATLAAIVESSNEAIVGEALDGTITSWNAGAERLFGYKAEEVVGRPVSLLIPPDHPDEVLEILQTITHGQRVQRLEAERVRKGGERVVVWLSVSPIKDSTGRIIGAAKIAHDVTDLRRAQEALRAARDSAEAAKAVAEQANQAKDQFLAVLSHELRTPLTPVLAAADLLARNTTLPEEIQEDAEMIRRNVTMEARLIDDLLDLTRVAKGKIELAKEYVDLGTVLQRTVEVCMPDIEARRLHFGMELKDTPHRLHADPSRLQQVFWNVLKNAIKFTPPGGCVGVRCYRRQDGQAVVEVADSGVGIESTALSKIFDAFEQADRAVTRQFGGLGLGLAISKAMVKLHGGTISAHSDGKGKGATFRVVLPTVTPVAEPPAAEANDDPPDTTEKPQLRILLVEDHGDTARVMAHILQREGHEVRTAGDVASALELAGSEAFDLIISDLGLPDGSGLDLMRQLSSKHHEIKGIALSGYGSEEDVKRSRQVGFVEHLIKPVDLEQLHAAVARVAEKR
ncbi:MAG TPA: PAS domain S-box protein, partial [Tepidisphaeraceae bacterium]|nr:PAS domain S-box protein [Tepidisphaeraceae bacterium]